jgi:hypothetical protein
MNILIHFSNQLVAEAICQLSSITAIACKHEDAHLTSVLLSTATELLESGVGAGKEWGLMGISQNWG